MKLLFLNYNQKVLLVWRYAYSGGSRYSIWGVGGGGGGGGGMPRELLGVLEGEN